MKHVDVLVRGAGIVGQSLALSLARLGLQVGLRPDEPRAKADPATPDVRAYALNASSVALLKSLKVWDALPAHAATPVYDMHVQGDAEGAAIAFSAWEQRSGELAWIVDAPVLERELGAALRFSPHVHRLSAAQADHVKADLVALCEGKASATRAALGVRFERHDYGHSDAAPGHGAAVVPRARRAGAAALRCARAAAFVCAGVVAAARALRRADGALRRRLRRRPDGRHARRGRRSVARFRAR
jgi:2-polyprenyl-6-methoxyphenol hydroxylase-like FAD-dependent oxidoreductase